MTQGEVLGLWRSETAWRRKRSRERQKQQGLQKEKSGGHRSQKGSFRKEKCCPKIESDEGREVTCDLRPVWRTPHTWTGAGSAEDTWEGAYHYLLLCGNLP